MKNVQGTYTQTSFVGIQDRYKSWSLDQFINSCSFLTGTPAVEEGGWIFEVSISS